MKTERTKHWTAVALAAAIVSATAGCATTRTIDTAGAAEMTLADLGQTPEALARHVGEAQRPLVLRLAAGESLPVHVRVVAPFARLDAEAPLTFTRDVLVYLTRDGVWLSPDGSRWAAIHDGEAIKEVFGAEGGYLSVGFSASKERGATLDVDLGLQ